MLTSAVFLAQLLLARSRIAGSILGLMVLHGDGLRAGMVWQPLTYMLLHGGVGHILMNMLR